MDVTSSSEPVLMRRRPCISGDRKRRFKVPSVADNGSDAANSGMYWLRYAASSTSASPAAVMRSLRESPEPFSRTSSGISMLCAGQEIVDGLACRLRRRRPPGIFLGAHGQEDRASHGVARVFVDEADDFGQRQRLVRIEQFRVGRQRAEPHAAAERAAGLLPEGLEQAERIVGRLHDGPRHARTARSRPHSVRKARCDCRVGPSGIATMMPPDAAAARPWLESHAVVDGEVGGPGIHARAHAARRRIGHGADGDGLEIDQQRVRQHVVGLVRAVVEGRAVVALRREKRSCR